MSRLSSSVGQALYKESVIAMDKIMSERRQTLRCELRTRVHLYIDETDDYENAHLENINYTGIYLMTRRKLAMNQEVEIAMPPDNTMDEPLKIKAKVMRYGKHRAWGLFSYACRILHSS